MKLRFCVCLRGLVWPSVAQLYIPAPLVTPSHQSTLTHAIEDAGLHGLQYIMSEIGHMPHSRLQLCFILRPLNVLRCLCSGYQEKYSKAEANPGAAGEKEII